MFQQNVQKCERVKYRYGIQGRMTLHRGGKLVRKEDICVGFLKKDPARCSPHGTDSLVGLAGQLSLDSGYGPPEVRIKDNTLFQITYKISRLINILGGKGLQVIVHLGQIAVVIAEIHRADGARGAGADHAGCQDGHVVMFQRPALRLPAAFRCFLPPPHVIVSMPGTTV